MYPQTISAAAWAEIQRTEQFVRGRADAYAIPRVSGEFLHTLILATGCRRAVELGTSYGYSGLWIGSALAHQAGTLLTIERDPLKVTRARECFARAGLENTITVDEGAAAGRLEHAAGPFDFAFLDVDKENTLRYFETLWPRLARRAVIVTDNIVSHANELRDFAAHLRRHPQVCSTLVDFGSGLELSVKLDGPDGAAQKGSSAG